MELNQLNQDVKIIAPLYINKYLLDLPKDIVIGAHISSIHPRLNRTIFKINNYLSPFFIKKYVPNIIHETYYWDSPIIKSKCPRILTVHDMIHERFKHNFASNDNTIELKRKAVLRADHIITVSNSTKKDLIEIYKINENKITTIYHGIYPALTEENISNQKKLFSKPYLLYVGNRAGYKNFDLLIKAIGLSKKIKTNINLVTFGGPPLSGQEMKLIKSVGLELNQVIYINGNDSILSNLYQNAEAFVFPSLYEGFGIPSLEAMLNGCPVISNNTSSMPEVIGDAGEYFNPESIEEMIYAIEKVIFSNARRAELIELGFQRTTMFSWKKCANETLNIYKTLL